MPSISKKLSFIHVSINLLARLFFGHIRRYQIMFSLESIRSKKQKKYSAITLISLEAWNVMTKFCKGSFLNDVSSEGEGGGPP